MKKTLLVLLIICVMSGVFLTVEILRTRQNTAKVPEINAIEKKEEPIAPPTPVITNREIIAKNLTLDNLTPEDVAYFLNLDLDAPASSAEVLEKNLAKLTTFSGLFQSASKDSVTIAPLFNAPESFAFLPTSKIERNNDEVLWEKLVKGDRVDLIALDGQVVKMVSSGLITNAELGETVSEATSLPPELVDKLLKGDLKGLEQDALNSVKTYLTSYYGIPADAVDAIISGNFTVSQETVEQLLLGKLIGVLGNTQSSNVTPTTES